MKLVESLAKRRRGHRFFPPLWRRLSNICR